MNSAPPTPVVCANGKQFSLNLVAVTNKSGSTFSLTNNASGGARSPFGPYATNLYSSASFTVPFVNGAGATPSKVTLSNTYLGQIDPVGSLYATGTLNITKTGGSLLTLL